MVISLYGHPSWDAEEERYKYICCLLSRESPPPNDLLELGAAPGVLSVALVAAGYRVTAIDLGEASDSWGNQAEGTMASAFQQVGVQLVLQDLESIPYPFPDGSFGIVLLTEVLEHLREYPARVIMEARRLLQRGGILLITTPNAASIQNRVRLATGRSIYTSLEDWIYGLPHARHAREYTVHELRYLLQHSGFEAVSIEARHFHLTSGRQSAPARAVKHAIDKLGRLSPAFGANLVVIARRL